jgi:hypothetical protein
MNVGFEWKPHSIRTGQPQAVTPRSHDGRRRDNGVGLAYDGSDRRYDVRASHGGIISAATSERRHTVIRPIIRCYPTDNPIPSDHNPTSSYRRFDAIRRQPIDDPRNMTELLLFP